MLRTSEAMSREGDELRSRNIRLSLTSQSNSTSWPCMKLAPRTPPLPSVKYSLGTYFLVLALYSM